MRLGIRLGHPGPTLIQIQVRDRYLLLMQDVFQMRQPGGKSSAGIAFLHRNRCANAIAMQGGMQFDTAQLLGVHRQMQFVGAS